MKMDQFSCFEVRIAKVGLAMVNKAERGIPCLPRAMRTTESGIERPFKSLTSSSPDYYSYYCINIPMIGSTPLPSINPKSLSCRESQDLNYHGLHALWFIILIVMWRAT